MVDIKIVATLILVLLLGLGIKFSDKNIDFGRIEGNSLCSEEECLIESGNYILLESTVGMTEVMQGDILCTDDNICHVLTEQSEEGFCTEGVTPLSINRCYEWNQLEGKILADINLRLATMLLIFIYIIIFIKKR